MITDIWFYLAAIPAILITGISKGGFGGALGVMAVPILSLVIPPAQAAAIMLPLLCCMDLFGVWAYRSTWSRKLMWIILPAALAGILLATSLYSWLEDYWIRFLIGLLAIGFTMNYWLGLVASMKASAEASSEGKPPSRIKGYLWGSLAGFTSFVAHAGGPPISVYLLPLKLDKTIFVGTTVMFFTSVNYIKLVPYAWLGQFPVENLTTSLVLIPLAFVGIKLGIWLHHRIDAMLFYRVCYLFLFFTGIKLVYDGIAGFLGA